MRSLFFCFRTVCALLVFVAVATSACSQEETTQDSLFTHFSLAVYDYDTGIPLDSAKVEVQSSTQFFILHTNREGEVRFDFCCNYTAIISISFESYKSESKAVCFQEFGQLFDIEFFLKKVDHGCSDLGVYFSCHTAEVCFWNGIDPIYDLNLVVQALTENPKLGVRLQADLSEFENHITPNLGLARMNSVKKYLINHGVNSDKVTLGEVRMNQNPSKDRLNETEYWSCESLNRRVSFSFFQLIQ